MSSSDLVPIEREELEEWEGDEEVEETAEGIAAQITDAVAEISRLTSEAQEIGAQSPVDLDSSTALVPTDTTAKQAKKNLAGVRAKVVRQQMELDKRKDLIRAKQEEIKELMYKQMQLAEKMIGPLEKFIDRLNEGIWMVNLYLGRDEEILLLRDGEPAPADEPVVIRQMVLAMDEECAVNPEEQGIDASDIEEFDKWLQADPAHVDQVAPEQKCVVAFRPRFTDKQYDDPWKMGQLAEANKQTYFLIRNGDRLFRTWTEFNVGKNLVPTQDEFSSFFFEEHSTFEHRRKGTPLKVPITPGTPAWERAEEAADARQRHFMRVGLILQGLVDRTTVFHPLPDGGISFMDYEHGGKTWRFLLDGERLLTTGRQPFYEWLAEKNVDLRVGMRIVGAFGSWGFKQHEYDGHYRNSRVRPPSAKSPMSNVLHVIEDKEHGAFVIRYDRREQIWKRNIPIPDRPGWVQREGLADSTKRVSALIFPTEDKFILPFDLVTEEEMVGYLGSRVERHAYVDMFPLLKAAISLKRSEREEEAPFRLMLAGVLARDNGVELAEAEEALDSLIEWWKLTNKNHRPLVGDEQSQAKAVRMIVAEHARRVKAEKKGAKSEVVIEVLRQQPHAILVARKRSGRYTALVPENDADVFVKEIEYTASGKEITHAQWKRIEKKRVVRWMILHKTERYDGWLLDAPVSDHLTGPEYDRMVEGLMRARDEKTLAIAYKPEKREFHVWSVRDGAVVDDEHPLAGALKEPTVRHDVRQWKRVGIGAPTLGPARSSKHSGWMDQRRPWDTRREDGGPSEWRDTSRNLFTVLFEDEGRWAALQVERDRYGAAVKRQRALRIKVEALLDSIEDAWTKRREGEIYERFLEEYLDPELWEGHKKTLPRDTFSYPHEWYDRGYSGGRGTPGMVALTVEHAVETGIDLAGLTVTEALAQHLAPREWIQLRCEMPKNAKKHEWPTADEEPEDIMGLRFAAVPDEEEGDDDAGTYDTTVTEVDDDED